jgi:hypothetical protein
MKLRYLLVLAVVAYMAVMHNAALANRRHFTYTYESAVLPKGSHELEIWNTVRLNRKDFFRGLDTRSEFEFGLGGNFQTSLYLNVSSELDNAGGIDQTFGFSNEWKYKLLDAAADPFGLALYGEGSYTNSEIELEGKIILDKQIDQFLFAFNAVGEHSFVSGLTDSGIMTTQTEEVMELDGGIAYFLSQNFTVGIEARNHIKRPPGLEGGGTYSALFIGPSLSFAGPNWWAALSVMPQITGSAKSQDNILSPDKLDLNEHEKLEARIVLAFEF